MNIIYYSESPREDSEQVSPYRLYTFTIKGSFKHFKGSFILLYNAFLTYCKLVSYNSFKYVVEDEDTNNIHIHALIECPFIKDKNIIAKKLFGWSTKADIVRFNSTQDIEAIWNMYINKQFSDSDKFEKTYGNCFN